MEGAYPNHLRIWDHSGSSVDPDLFGPPGAETMVLEPNQTSQATKPELLAERLFACESVSPPPKNATHEDGEPYTLQWFLNIENHRHGKHARWIPRILEFAKHQGETLLGLGHGLGTDWIQYARNGASVIVSSSCTSQLDLIRRHFELRGLEGRFLHNSPESLTLPNSSVDVACISGLLQQMENPQAVVDEIFRVLKPGGKVIAVTPAKYDVDFWRKIFFFWQRWLSFKKRTPPSSERRFSGRRLRRLFDRYDIHKVYKRQLRRSELPHLWRLWPLPIMERLVGRVLVIKAFKPVSTAIQMTAAA